MSERCVAAEDLGAVLELPAEHPARRHLAECPRCRALAATYVEFMEDRSVPAGARPEELAQRLRPPLAGAAVAPPGSPVRPPSLIRRIAASVAMPSLRPAYVAAAVVVLAGAVYLTWRDAQGPEQDVLRSGTTAPAFEVALAVAPGGAVELHWPAVPGATGYDVVLLDAGLAELGSLDAAAETTFVLTPAALARAGSGGPAAAVQVVARNPERVIASTSPEPLPTPHP